jgi:hypothetical protein
MSNTLAYSWSAAKYYSVSPLPELRVSSEKENRIQLKGEKEIRWSYKKIS